MKPCRKELHIRLYVVADLAPGNAVLLNKEQAHYLGQVMRRNVADRFGLFNGRDGEWIGEITAIDKKSASVMPVEQVREQNAEPDIWLLFAPLKNHKNEKLIEQATELGVSRIVPVKMQHGIVDKIHQERWQQCAIEASEQSERLTIPEVTDLTKMDQLLAAWPEGRKLIIADESGKGPPLPEVLSALPPQTKSALMLGPEGGFSTAEFALLRSLNFTLPATLGPRILKADTAAITALACVASVLGDWDEKPKFRSEN